MAQIEIKQINILSLAKIMFLLHIVFGLILGIIGGIMMFMFSGPLSGIASMGYVIPSIWVVVVLIPLSSGIGGFILGIILGLIYNLITKLFGGVKMEMIDLDMQETQPPSLNPPQN